VRVDFTRLRVIENKNMRVESTRVRIESTRMRVVKKKLSTGLLPVDLRFMVYLL
jgi:hypothetical protein